MDLKEQVEQALKLSVLILRLLMEEIAIEEITSDNVVKLKLLGNCGSCKMSFMTMKAGIEQAIMKAVPQITAVEAINLTESV